MRDESEFFTAEELAAEERARRREQRRLAALRKQFDAKRSQDQDDDDEEDMPSSSSSLLPVESESRKVAKRQKILAFNGMFVGDDFFTPLEVRLKFFFPPSISRFLF